LLAVALLFNLLAAACDGDGDEEKENGFPPPTELTPQATPDVAPVTYTIADREDVSFGAVVRIVYRVGVGGLGVGGSLTEEKLRRIAQEIIDDETAQEDVNAIGFFFYLPGTEITGVYTAGKADWAPDGDWASADTVQAGDYSRHELGAIDIVSP
jgi:hypothetical protein